MVSTDDVISGLATVLQPDKETVQRTVLEDCKRVAENVFDEAGLQRLALPPVFIVDEFPQHLYNWITGQLSLLPKDISSHEAVDRVYQSLRKNMRVLLKQDEPDPLGCYVHCGGKPVAIRIFWIPLVVTANRLKISLEPLAYKVLVHEVAHFATHVGSDCDGGNWATQFAHLETKLKEGLANYYTWFVLQRGKNEQQIQAFQRLIRCQHPNYRSYQHLLRAAGYKHFATLFLHVRERSRSALLASRQVGNASFAAHCKELRRRRICEAAELEKLF